MTTARFVLFTQRPNPRLVGEGTLSVHTDGTATFYQRGAVRAELSRARLDFAGADGIAISGLRQLKDSLVYQEWWLRYV